MNRHASGSLVKWASRLFLFAGGYGLLLLLPQYLSPPPGVPIEHHLGFLGVAVAWQLAFLLISRDVVRLRPLMLAAVAEKFLFAVPILVSGAVWHLPVAMVFVLMDLLLGCLFLTAYFFTGRQLARS